MAAVYQFQRQQAPSVSTAWHICCELEGMYAVVFLFVYRSPVYLPSYRPE